MKKKRVAAVAVTMVALISALSGTYAYFSDMKEINVNAVTSNLAIKVDNSEFTNEKVCNMLPGDTRELSYTISNIGEADVMAFSEITLHSTIAMSDTVEWFIQDAGGSTNDEDRHVTSRTDGDYYDDVTVGELMNNKIKFVSLTNNNKVATFVVNHGVLSDNNDECKVDLELMLGLNAGNLFMNSDCEITANVYGIQSANTDSDLTWDFIKTTAEANGAA